MYKLNAMLLLLFFVASAQAANVVEPLNQIKVPMKSLVQFILKARYSAETQAVLAIKKQAELAREAAHVTFLGGVRLEAERQWTRPGVSQSTTLPLPDALGGPVSISSVIVPKNQTIYGIGGELPLVNIQALYGVKMAKELGLQAEFFERAKREESTLRLTQQLLRYHVLMKSVEAKKDALNILQERLNYTQLRRRAGMAPVLEESQAEAELQWGVLKVQQLEGDLEKLKLEIETDAGDSLSLALQGATLFPYQEPQNTGSGHTAKPHGLVFLEQLLKVQLLSIELSDSAFYPQVLLGWGYQKKEPYLGGSGAQTQVALKARWDILDGGSRKRLVAKDYGAVAELSAQFEQAQQKVTASYRSLAKRYKAILASLAAAKNARLATLKAQQAAQDAYRAGLVKFIDVREADRNVTESTLAVIELEAAEQGLAIESLYVQAEWLKYLQRVAEEP